VATTNNAIAVLPAIADAGQIDARLGRVMSDVDFLATQAERVEKQLPSDIASAQVLRLLVLADEILDHDADALRDDALRLRSALLTAYREVVLERGRAEA